MSRTRVYKTVKGIMRQMHGRLSVDDVLSGRYNNSKHGYVNFRFTDEALREFSDGVCSALNMRDKDDVFYNIKHKLVEQCGIIDRISVSLYRGELDYSYCAGQDYPSEARLVRKLLRCK